MAFQDIRKARPILTPTEFGFLLLVLALLAGLLMLNIYLARTYQRGEWLFLRWSGVRAHILEESEPYGSVVAKRVQEIVYGRDAFLNEYPYVLNDPFYIVLLYFPLSFFSDFRIAQGIWMLFAQIALIGIIVLSLRLSEWESPRWLYAALILFGLFNSFSVEALLSGSPSIFLIFLYLCILTALRAGSDELAGGLLLLIAYQWEVGALFFFLVIVLAVADRRWGVFTGFGMTGLIFLIISLLAKPAWIIPYLSAIRFDWIHGVDYTVAITLAYLFPRLPVSIAGWIPFAVGGILIYETAQSLFSHPRHLAWLAFLALAFNPILGFVVFPANHVAFLPALVLIILLAWERWTNQRVFVSLLLLALVMALPYALQVQVDRASDRYYADLARVLPPALTVLGLYWMRWWAIRPPRIWADQFGLQRRPS